MSAENAGDAKRARHTQAHCSPFRAQIGTIAASLPTSNSSNNSSSSALLQLRDANERDDSDVSPFASISGRAQLSSGQLESYLRAEIRYLKRRQLIPRRKLNESATSRDGRLSESSDAVGSGPPAKQANLSGGNCSGAATVQPSDARSYRMAPNSPSANSGSESDGESSMTVTGSMNSQKIASALNLYDRPQFSLKQVQMICERLLKQQEVRLRYEYETVLNQRLDEQHEQYVQFAREQLERQHQDSNAEISYLS